MSGDGGTYMVEKTGISCCSAISSCAGIHSTHRWMGGGCHCLETFKTGEHESAGLVDNVGAFPSSISEIHTPPPPLTQKICPHPGKKLLQILMHFVPFCLYFLINCAHFNYQLVPFYLKISFIHHNSPFLSYPFR
jgi:hypothetical protein